MRKFIVLIFSFFILLTGVNAIEKPAIDEGNKVTIYMFRSDQCIHCHSAVEYFYNIVDEYKDYFELTSFEISGNADNKNLFYSVLDKLGKDTSQVGVPYFIIGDNYATAGFSEGVAPQIIETALKEFQNENYKDVVKEVKKNHTSGIVEESAYDAAVNEGIEEGHKTTSANSQKEGYIVLGTFIVIIGVVVILLKKYSKQ